MRKRVFGSICLTSFVTLLLTAALLMIAVYSGMESDVRDRLKNESIHLVDVSEDRTLLERIGRSYAERITLIAENGDVLYDNQGDASQMENHLSRPEVAQAIKTGVGQGQRLSHTLDRKTYYYAVRLPDGAVLRLGSTADSAFGALRTVSPWIVLVLLLTLLVAALLASWLTHILLAPIIALDLRQPLKNAAYDELSPLLHRMAAQNKKIDAQMDELKRRQAEFDDITTRMDEGLVLLSAQGEILFANHASRRLFPKEEAHGTYLTLCRDPEYIRVVEQALSGESTRGKLERDGRAYALTASSVAGEGQGHAAVLFIVDVTEREQAERQRQEFSANVSHELKTPLTSIMGIAEIMENGIVRPEDIGRFAGSIRSEATRLLALIEDIIRLSRLDEGGMQESFEPVDLYAVCVSVRDRLQQKAMQNRIALTLEGEMAVVSGVRQTLEQMAFNLCDNAITYNRPDGSVTLFAGIACGQPVLRVSDTGIGIAPADQARVFERFYRVDKSHAKSTGGTGLGLSIVKHGAQLHGAEVSMQSVLDRGTTIEIRFPKG